MQNNNKPVKILEYCKKKITKKLLYFHGLLGLSVVEGKRREEWKELNIDPEARAKVKPTVDHLSLGERRAVSRWPLRGNHVAAQVSLAAALLPRLRGNVQQVVETAKNQGSAGLPVGS